MRHILHSLLLTVSFFAAHGKTAFTGKTDDPQRMYFVENKGQMTDQFMQPREDIKFSLQCNAGLNLFFGKATIYYQFRRPLSDGKIEMYRMEVALSGANLNAPVTGQGQQPLLETFYIKGTAWGKQVRSYKLVEYKNIYPGIDWKFYVTDGKLKHEFIVHENGNAADIKLSYKGVNRLSIEENGRLIASTRMGNVEEEAPKTFYKGKQINSAYRIKDNTLSFETGAYTSDLVIDPMLKWSTYYGGSEGEEIKEVNTDAAGNVYVTGSTNSSSGIATTGAYSTTFADGGFDMFLAKFDTAGHRIWATYYGTSIRAEGGFAVTPDKFGGVYVSGKTTDASTSATNAFLAKFDTAGNFRWDTSYVDPSSNNSYGVSVAPDKFGNVYVFVNVTTYAAAIPVLPLILKYDSAGNHMWERWPMHHAFSGDRSSGEGMVCDSLGNLYITGETTIISGLATPGAYATTILGGGADTYAMKLDSSCTPIWCTYWGSGYNDVNQSIAIDKNLNVYIASDYLNTSTFWRECQLVKFNTTGTVKLWDKLLTDMINSVATDNAGNVYVGGSSFVSYYNSAGVLGYFTTFGPGAGQEQGYSVTAGKFNDFYLAGYTGSASGIATASGHQISLNGSVDAFLARYVQCTMPVAGTISGTSTVCVGNTVALSTTGAGGNWSIAGSTVATISGAGVVTGTAMGTATVTYTTINACGTSTATFTITVISGPPCTSEIELIPKTNKLVVTPNPSKGEVLIHLESLEIASGVTITVTNAFGQRVKEVVSTDGSTLHLQLDQPAGTYLICISDGKNKYFGKLVKE